MNVTELDLLGASFVLPTASLLSAAQTTALLHFLHTICGVSLKASRSVVLKRGTLTPGGRWRHIWGGVRF